MAATLDDFERLAAADRFLAIVSVARPDRSVHTSLVNAGVLPHPVDDAPVVGFVASGAARKLAYLRAASSAAVTVHHSWQWMAVEGPVELIGPDDPAGGVEVPQLLRAIFRAAGGAHDDWNEFDRVMASERRTAVFVRPGRLVTNATS
ncbi:MAG TPA: hypothetical protein VGZ52_01265 [Acidimicrobiales bacterium]|jgi:hypothetical protein|nr:hypothetical protein [Acidimicrobiales bacterium]